MEVHFVGYDQVRGVDSIILTKPKKLNRDPSASPKHWSLRTLERLPTEPGRYPRASDDFGPLGRHWCLGSRGRPTAHRKETGTDCDWCWRHRVGWNPCLQGFLLSSLPYTALCPHTSSSLQKKCLHERMVIHTRTFISELEDAQSLGLVLHSRYKGQG